MKRGKKSEERETRSSVDREARSEERDEIVRGEGDKIEGE